MYENNNGVTQEVQAAPEKKSGGNWVWITFLLLGVVLLVIGIILYKNTNIKERAKLKDYSQSYSASEVKRFDLDISWADLTIGKSSDEKIHVEARNVPEGFTAEVKGDTFSAKTEDKKMNVYLLPSWLNDDDNNTVIDIKLPDKEYESFVLDLGAGEVTVSDIVCGKFRVEGGAGEITFESVECETGSFECGAGQVNINDMQCAETLYVDGGTGEIDITKSVLGGLKVEQGVGEFNFSGTINGDVEVDGGVGEINLNLTNPASDFMGSGSKYKMDIDTGIGSNTVNYDVSH